MSSLWVFDTQHCVLRPLSPDEGWPRVHNNAGKIRVSEHMVPLAMKRWVPTSVIIRGASNPKLLTMFLNRINETL